MPSSTPSSAPSMHAASDMRRTWIGMLLLALVLGFAFQGTRGLWNTDEGRYTGGALQMIDSGNYLAPAYSDDRINFTKPPMTYWAIAASVKLFGRNTWAVRVPNALAYALTVLLILAMGRVLVPDRPWLPALVYATSLAPFFAANVVSTDDILTLFEALAMYGFIRAYFDSADRPALPRGGIVLMWLGFGLAFLTKGPPGLLPLLGVLPFVIHRDGGAGARRLFWWPGLLVFAVAGLAWYGIVIARYPWLLDYYLKHEVYDRLFTGMQRRNPQWYGWIRAYGPVFVVGTLPWWAPMARGIRQVASRARWRQWWQDAGVPLFLLCWFLIPLAVFCIAQSRLSVYVLPLFIPFSLMLARVIRPDFTLSSLRQKLLVGAWIALLIGIKGGISQWATPRADDNTRAAELDAMVNRSSYHALGFVQDTAIGVKIEEHTPWGLRLNLDKPVYGIGWYGSNAVDQACTELRRHRSMLFIVDRELDVGEFRADVATCDGAHTQMDGRWRKRALVRAWIGDQAPAPASSSPGAH